LKVNYTCILLSPACGISPKARDLGHGERLSFQLPQGRLEVSRDKMA
jgi:hypothetical protein